MQLVPVYSDEADGSPAGTVRIPAEKQQLIGVKTAQAEVKVTGLCDLSDKGPISLSGICNTLEIISINRPLPLAHFSLVTKSVNWP